MDIEKLRQEPGDFFNGIIANITDGAIEFENRCMGVALRRWQISKEEVLARIREADTLRAENEKLRARINDLETQHRTEMCESGYDCIELGKLRAELEQMKREVRGNEHRAG